MPTIINFLKSKRNLFFASLLWILLWVIPWGKLPTVQENLYLAFLTDMIRLGIAIGIFIIPGVLLYFLLRDHNDLIHDRVGFISIGFALSASLIAVIGMIGRIAGFSFSLVRNIFALTGLVELVLMIFFKPDITQLKDRLREIFSGIGRNAPLLAALVIAILMTFHDLLFFIDDTSYLAYATNWQYSNRLSFINIVHEVNVIESVRFWLALYPMGQAMLSDLSGVPGILLAGNYLELFLVPLAVVTSYWFARVLGLSKRAAGFSVLIQVSLYVWLLGEFLPVGMWFYQNMAEDKVSVVFILAPVFFAFVLRFLLTSTKNNLALIFLSGLGLTLTHPIMLFYSCVIAGGLAFFSLVTRKTGWRTIFQLVMVFAAIGAPYAAIRVSGIQLQKTMSFTAEDASTTFEVERYLNIVNDVFYGMELGVLEFIDIPPESNGYVAFQFFRSIPIFLALLAGIIAFIKRKGGPLNWYVLSCVLLILLAVLPYTGWILGYFVSARVISRTSWFSPLGVGSILIAKTIMDKFKAITILEKQKLYHRFKGLNGTFIGIVVCFAFASPLLALNLTTRSASYFVELDHNKQLARMGAYIDQNTTGKATVIALDYTDMQKLPSIAAHTNLISFREATPYNGHNYFLSIGQIAERKYVSDIIRSLDPGTSYEERCRLLKKFNVRFVLAQSDNAEFFATEVGKGGMAAKKVLETKDLVLLELE